MWGVKLGPDRVGGLTGLGGDKLHFYLNGRPLRDPAAHQMRDGDAIVIGYGAADSFPHEPNTEAAESCSRAETAAALSCSPDADGRRVRAASRREARQR